jgi:entry exclusion lipoprotein TrbK
MRLAALLVAMAVASGLLAGCDQKPADTSKLTCKDDPAGRTKAEQQAIADACFHGGQYTKSPEKKW